MKNLVNDLVNNVSATNIYITSDHGFIYQRTGLNESDKLNKGDIESIEEGRRYILTNETRKKESTLTIPMKYILGYNLTGNPFLYLSVMFIIVSLQFFSIGLLGEINIRIYNKSESKNIYAIESIID